MKKSDLEVGLNFVKMPMLKMEKRMLYQKNGKSIEKYSISIEDRAFSYGDGCFTTARFKEGKIQLWARHLKRFSDAIDALQLNCSISRIESEAAQFITQLKQNAYGTVKIVISRGVAPRGYALPDSECDVYFYFYETTPHLTPLVLHQIGVLDDPLGSTMPKLQGLKTLNRLEQVMLKATAQQQGYTEALCFDMQHHLVEAISSNCFIYINGEWLTPDLALSGINGTMRQEILQRMHHYQIKHQIRIIARSEIPQVEAAFLCNALQPMQMIQKLAHFDLQLAPCEHLFQTLSLQQLV